MRQFLHDLQTRFEYWRLVTLPRWRRDIGWRFSRQVTVTVTRGDLRRGHDRSASECPVALAIARALKREIGEVLVWGPGGLVQIDPGGVLSRWSYYIEIPDRIASWIRTWDDAHYYDGQSHEAVAARFEPFSFTIEVPR